MRTYKMLLFVRKKKNTCKSAKEKKSIENTIVNPLPVAIRSSERKIGFGRQLTYTNILISKMFKRHGRDVVTKMGKQNECLTNGILGLCM